MPSKRKLKFKPTPISRLLKYQTPIKMVGDPYWSGHGRKAWANRERAVYAHMMERKKWPMSWLPETWNKAWEDNEMLDFHISMKWVDYPLAWQEHKFLSTEEAEKDNAAWDYHHENFLAA